jgi:hypothetical protein
MFQVDAKAKRLATMTKSGCCWHQYNTYSVVHHEPSLIESVEESVAPFSRAYVKVQKTGKHRSTEWVLAAESDSGIAPILAFDLTGGGHKHVEVFADEGVLDYALVVGSSRRVEFSYELDVLGERRENASDQTPPFQWDPSARELSFRNGDVRYIIHDSPERLGVSVHEKGRTVFLEGERKSRRGDLSGLPTKELTNVELATSSGK